MRYRIFKRHWWRENPDWPDGLEPDAGPKRTICYVGSERQAVALCKRFNDQRGYNPLGIMYEYEADK